MTLGIVERLRNGGQADLADIAELMLETLEMVAQVPATRGVYVLDVMDIRSVHLAIRKAAGEQQ